MLHFHRRTLLGAGLAFLTAGTAQAAKPPVYTRLFSKLALNGHDTVAYFKQGMPVKGSPEFTHEYKGAVWQFASAANRDLFVANPEAYAPQYGGYCAWAAAQGDTASADPMFWKIVDQKLYLNYDSDVQKKWEKDIPGFIRKADQNWPGILGN